MQPMSQLDLENSATGGIFREEQQIGMYSLAIGAFALAITGCGGNKSETSEAPAPAASAPAGKTVDPATAGEVTGSVKLDGAAPKMKAINMAAEPACAKVAHNSADQRRSRHGRRRRAGQRRRVCEKRLEGYSFPAPSTPVKIEQQGCQYHPHVVAMQVGQNIDVVNDDQTTHNIHPIPAHEPGMERIAAPGAAPIEKSFAREEIAIPGKVQRPPVDEGLHGGSSESLFPGDGQGR